LYWAGVYFARIWSPPKSGLKIIRSIWTSSSLAEDVGSSETFTDGHRRRLNVERTEGRVPLFSSSIVSADSGWVISEIEGQWGTEASVARVFEHGVRRDFSVFVPLLLRKGKGEKKLDL